MKQQFHFFIIIILSMSLSTAAQQNKSMLWIGGPTYILMLGSFKILTDPMLGPESDSSFMIKQHPSTGEANAWIQRLIAPAVFDETGIDLLLISHPHADHIDNKAKETLNHQLHIISPAVDVKTIEGWGFTNIVGLNWNESDVLKKDNESLAITAVEAVHAADEPLRSQLGKGNGYIIEYRSPKEVYRIYWTGDTVWFDEINGYRSFGKIDLLIPDMGAVGSDGKIGRRGLDASDCLHIAEVLNPVNIIPVHHTTFSMYVEPIDVLRTTMDNTKFKPALHIIKAGETFKL